MTGSPQFLAVLGLVVPPDTAPGGTSEQDRRAAILALASAKGFPRIFVAGRPAGYGAAVWERFTRTAHPDWLPWAERTLAAYQPGAELVGWNELGLLPRDTPEGDCNGD